MNVKLSPGGIAQMCEERGSKRHMRFGCVGIKMPDKCGFTSSLGVVASGGEGLNFT